jgi:hypothetical protein
LVSMHRRSSKRRPTDFVLPGPACEVWFSVPPRAHLHWLPGSMRKPLCRWWRALQQCQLLGCRQGIHGWLDQRGARWPRAGICAGHRCTRSTGLPRRLVKGMRGRVVASSFFLSFFLYVFDGCHKKNNSIMVIRI